MPDKRLSADQVGTSSVKYRTFALWSRSSLGVHGSTQKPFYIILEQFQALF